MKMTESHSLAVSTNNDKIPIKWESVCVSGLERNANNKLLVKMRMQLLVTARRKGGERERERTRSLRKSENDSVVQCCSQQTNFAADKTAYFFGRPIYSNANAVFFVSMVNGDGSFSGCFRCPLKFERTAYFYQIQFGRKLIRNEQLNQEIRQR